MFVLHALTTFPNSECWRLNSLRGLVFPLPWAALLLSGGTAGNDDDDDDYDDDDTDDDDDCAGGHHVLPVRVQRPAAGLRPGRHPCPQRGALPLAGGTHQRPRSLH